MRTYWDNGGQPLPDGRLRFVTDLEDGTDPQFTYGRTQEEIFEKLALTNAHAQLAIARRTAPAAGPRPVAAAAAPATRPMLSADERMQLTVDLQNPAKSAEAIAKLHQDATGIDRSARRSNGWPTWLSSGKASTPNFIRMRATSICCCAERTRRQAERSARSRKRF